MGVNGAGYHVLVGLHQDILAVPDAMALANVVADDPHPLAVAVVAEIVGGAALLPLDHAVLVVPSHRCSLAIWIDLSRLVAGSVVGISSFWTGRLIANGREKLVCGVVMKTICCALAAASWISRDFRTSRIDDRLGGSQWRVRA